MSVKLGCTDTHTHKDIAGLTKFICMLVMTAANNRTLFKDWFMPAEPV